MPSCTDRLGSQVDIHGIPTEGSLTPHIGIVVSQYEIQDRTFWINAVRPDKNPKEIPVSMLRKRVMLAIGAGATLVSLPGCLSEIALD